MSLFRPIHHTFAPHVSRREILQVLGLLCVPWKWKQGRSTEKLSRMLCETSKADTFLFASGREALLALFRALELQPGDEIIIQGYTCVVLPNAIHEAGGVPIFADIDQQTLNMDPLHVESLVTARTRGIVCQHTFGIPADTKKLRSLCDQHGIALIEDCAHIIPDAAGPDDIAERGDFIIFSFGRDKALSGITGGALLSKHQYVSDLILNDSDETTDLSLRRIGAYLCYPIVYGLSRPFIGIGFGKLVLTLARSIGLLVPIVEEEEKRGYMEPQFHHMPNACAYLVLRQWKRLNEINAYRRMLTQEYIRQADKYAWSVPSAVHRDLPLQKFPILVENASAIREALKRNNIHLDDGWTDCTVCPPSVDPNATPYPIGNTPNAKNVAKRILSLPTHPTMLYSQTRTLVSALADALHYANVS